MTLLTGLLISLFAFGDGYNNRLIDVPAQIESRLEDVANSIQPGSIVIVSEEHDNEIHHNHQVQFLKALSNNSSLKKISVGMEFLEFPDQKKVDYFLEGVLSEREFLQLVNWSSGSPFEFYREQVLFPKITKARTYALNLPRTISKRISQVGVSGLTADERRQLPADFQVGNDLYRARFEESMGGHGNVDSTKMNRYFEAQSAWDDTMATQALNAMKELSDGVLVILVGNFHAEFGGGLPDRLASRGFKNLTTITQYEASHGNEEDLVKRTSRHPEYGYISDYMWISGEPK